MKYELYNIKSYYFGISRRVTLAGTSLSSGTQ